MIADNFMLSKLQVTDFLASVDYDTKVPLLSLLIRRRRKIRMVCKYVYILLFDCKNLLGDSVSYHTSDFLQLGVCLLL